MIVAVEIPDYFAKQFHLDGPQGPRLLLEAFLLQQYAEREVSAGQIAKLLGLSWHETEQFLHDHKAPGITPEEHLEDVQNLERFLSEKGR